MRCGANRLPSVEAAIARLGLKMTVDQFVTVFRVPGPALISFSGGRTSALMLWCILVAYGGELPPNVVVAFANTGKEREETLRFVHDCASAWGVHVHWLEWRPGEERFAQVSFNSASRQGEPFAGLIAQKGYLPNAVTRFCTSELKVRVMKHFILALGWSRWVNVVGLRFDEGKRIHRMIAANAAEKERWQSRALLFEAQIGVDHVSEFWSEEPFDLGLLPFEGNCDLCFLKGKDKLLAVIRRRPESPLWWSGQEQVVTTLRASSSGARFVTEYSYAQLASEAASGAKASAVDIDQEYDAECGLMCAAEAA